MPVKIAATRLGLPAAWLIAEAKEGKIPALVAGRRISVNPAAVERILLERAQCAPPPGEAVNA